jgi:hypothetical protein
MLAAQVEPKNETTKKCEKQRNHSLTRKAPYKSEGKRKPEGKKKRIGLKAKK